MGTPAVVRRPVQVFASEHFVRSQAAWTCTGAPITDPRDGRLIGVVDVSGPLETMHPATLAWVDSVAKLAEARLRELHLTSLERLRAVAAPVLARLGGPGPGGGPGRLDRRGDRDAVHEPGRAAQVAVAGPPVAAGAGPVRGGAAGRRLAGAAPPTSRCRAAPPGSCWT